MNNAYNENLDKDASVKNGNEMGKMSFIKHLEELRKRIIYIAIAIGVGFLTAYVFKEKIYEILTIPLKTAMPLESKLIYTSPAEAFFTYFKVSLLAGVIIASPVIFYQFWSFISPGLYIHEKRGIWPYFIFSITLFIIGSLFCYAIVFPFIFQFFMSFKTDDIIPMLKLNEYLSFSATLLFAFGVVFEVPIVFLFLAKMGLVTSKILRQNRKYAILIMFATAALFTPPDVISQIFMVVPLLLLYEISIWIVSSVQKRMNGE